MIPTVRALIAGNSGSGKTTLAWHLYLKQMPRILVIDQTGEWNGKVDVETDTLPDLVDAIRELARKGRWSVSYSLLDDRYEDLVDWLIPVPEIAGSPSIAVGGMTLLNDEVDLLAPFGPPSRHIRTLYRRSRHAGLSVLSLTSAPGNVSKEVARQSTHRIALFLDEPADIKYMTEAMRWTPEQVDYWLAWTQRFPHGAAWREVQTGRLLWLTDDRQAQDSAQAAVSARQQSQQPQPERRLQLVKPQPDADSQEQSSNGGKIGVQDEEPTGDDDSADESVET